MESVSLELLKGHFQSKIGALKISLELGEIAVDEDCHRYFSAIETELTKIQQLTFILKTLSSKRKEEIRNLKDQQQRLASLSSQISHMVDHVPEHLPNRKSAPNETRKDQFSKEDVVKTQISASAFMSTSTETSLPSQQPVPTKVTKQKNVYFPEIQYITVEEFESVPKYLKGRLTYNQINKHIDGMNQAYKSKYQLMKQKKSSMNDSSRKQFEVYKSQESKDTDGYYFIVENDMKTFGGVTVDRVARSILTILRHCARIREVRGGKITRYVYVDSY